MSASMRLTLAPELTSCPRCSCDSAAISNETLVLPARRSMLLMLTPQAAPSLSAEPAPPRAC